MRKAIAIVGMACRYPGARSPQELWEEVLAQRRAFRLIPPERLGEEYFDPDPEKEDCAYSRRAALLDDYRFDRLRFQVAGSTYRAADLAHWLALDVAVEALADAGSTNAMGIANDTAGAIVGNTLTGEFSRANSLRLRWPYVRQALERAAENAELPSEVLSDLITSMEQEYKAPFGEVNEETLAGGLSNTIAGRICNFLDWHGGGYTIDGACASSLLAVITACNALQAGDLDFALAGGVDLSLDPFELVGFSKARALARDEMRVYDKRSSGFWPGEGCGFVALMREEDALSQNRRVYARIAGWGVSSDGGGGMTRPELDGQLLAIARTYQRAGFGPDSVGYFEGHGTGTAVGDATELRALSWARRDAGSTAPVPVGSVKSNIGHTKAAAGIAGLMKAVMATHSGILPPATGCDDPHQELTGDQRQLKILRRAEPWPDGPRRAGVSAIGFGGINTHLTIEGSRSSKQSFSPSVSSFQDAELFVFSASSWDEALQQVQRLSRVAAKLSQSELTDAANSLARAARQRAALRAAVVAGTPSELAQQLATLEEHMQRREEVFAADLCCSCRQAAPRIGFLFPGQGSPAHVDGGLWRWRFSEVDELYRRHTFTPEQVQPAIVSATVSGLRILRLLGLDATVAAGHSLGELAALHFGGALDEATLLRLSEARGEAMSNLPPPQGGMASIAAGAEEVRMLIEEESVVISGFNALRQTTISGPKTSVQRVVESARARGVQAVMLPVGHAFHSPLMVPAVDRFRESLQRVELSEPENVVFSTVQGERLPPGCDIKALLLEQLTAPVRWTDALAQASPHVDLWIEVGPGNVLSRLCSECGGAPAISIDSCGNSFRDLLRAVGAAFALGAPVAVSQLFDDRFTRPFPAEWQPRFLTNPCEATSQTVTTGTALEPEPAAAAVSPNGGTASALETIRRLVAERAELPLSSVREESRLLQDLHLNSIVVAQIVGEAGRSLGLPPSVSPTDYADANILEIARALEDRKAHGGTLGDSRFPSGCDTWVRSFEVVLVEKPLPRAGTKLPSGEWRVFGLPLATPPSAGGGVMVFLPPDAGEDSTALLLDAARAVLDKTVPPRFVLVQHGVSAAPFVRTLHWENPQITTCVVDLPFECANAMDLIMAELVAANGHAEAHYDDEGKRYERQMRLLPPAPTPDVAPLTDSDVLLVSGGGKGIAAECAFRLAKETGVRLALLGRSKPEADEALDANLARMRSAGISVRYVSADVTDANAVERVVKNLESELGPITALLHGAGVNTPRLIAQLDTAAFGRTLAPKVAGLNHLLGAVQPNRLRMLVALGSIIAHIGFHGEADYAVANELLARRVEEWQNDHPHCRCLVVESSIWSGVGMGERLGRVDALQAQGITAITPDEGVQAVCGLLRRSTLPVRNIITGRFGEPKTLRMEKPELPLLRFLEEPKVVYPGVELVADSQISLDNDPYLGDHVFQGVSLFPAVLGLEAMMQAAIAVTGMEERHIVFEDAEFAHPVTVPSAGKQHIRVAALVHTDGSIQTVVRSEETGFAVDHFTARLRWADFGEESEPDAVQAETGGAMECGDDLYESTLFQNGRFRRLRAYSALHAEECVAEIGAPHSTNGWFGRYLPATVLLADPGARDATLHCVQACYPHAALLPARVHKISILDATSTCRRHVHAVERSRNGRALTYDLRVTDSKGRLLEKWEGVEFRIMNTERAPVNWSPALLVPYLERRLDAILAKRLSIQLRHTNRAATNGARANGAGANSGRANGAAANGTVWHRPDGKPETATNCEISIARSGGFQLTTLGNGATGCDVEQAVPRPWADFLTPERMQLLNLIKTSTAEPEPIAGTRLWCAIESLKKAGSSPQTPLRLRSSDEEGWVLLAAGDRTIATFLARLKGQDDPLVFAWTTRE